MLMGLERDNSCFSVDVSVSGGVGGKGISAAADATAATAAAAAAAPVVPAQTLLAHSGIGIV